MASRTVHFTQILGPLRTKARSRTVPSPPKAQSIQDTEGHPVNQEATQVHTRPLSSMDVNHPPEKDMSQHLPTNGHGILDGSTISTLNLGPSTFRVRKQKTSHDQQSDPSPHKPPTHKALSTQSGKSVCNPDTCIAISPQSLDQRGRGYRSRPYGRMVRLRDFSGSFYAHFPLEHVLARLITFLLHNL